MAIRLKGLNFTVEDPEAAVAFWQRFLNVLPTKISEGRIDFKIENLLISLRQGKATGGACRPLFAYSDIELYHYIDKAKQQGAEEVYDGLRDPTVKAVVLRDPAGIEFEIGRL